MIAGIGVLLASAFAAVAVIVAIVFFWLWSREKTRAAGLEGPLHQAMADLQRYQGIRDLEQAQAAVAHQLDAARSELGRAGAALQQWTAALDEKRRAVAVLEEMDGLHEVAFYRTRYGLPSASAYEARLDSVRGHQKAMIQAGRAAVCSKEWHVDGSVAKGRKMVNDELKLMLRAFNGECDAAIARVTYKNVEAMRQRIERAAESINKLGRVKDCSIVPEYLRSKLEELFLVHEHQEKVQAEREEQRETRARMAEEAREEREREKALREAEKEEARDQAALARAREELEHASAMKRAALEEEIARLQQRIADTQRRKSQAELTRSGHVYVISNVGSFGDGVFKIGMTRRLDPMDRVWELSDASVPFDFDVHAMVYCEDAPALETGSTGTSTPSG